MRDVFNVYGVCVGVKMEGVTYVDRHRFVDGQKHYSAGICNPCLELSKKLKKSRELSTNGLERELEETWVGLQPAEKGGIR